MSRYLHDQILDYLKNTSYEHNWEDLKGLFEYESVEESTEEVDDGKTVADADDVGNMADFEELDTDPNHYSNADEESGAGAVPYNDDKIDSDSDDSDDSGDSDSITR